MGQFHYSAFGLHVESELDLGRARYEGKAPPDITIRLGPVTGLHPSSTARTDHVRTRDVGSFLIRDGAEIIADLKSGVSPDLVRVLLTGRLMAYLLRQRGWFPLHGSAVQMGAGAVIFIAPAGTGKSTTAAALCSRGYTILSDDVSPVQVVQGQCLLQPGYPRLRLCDDAANEFCHLDPARSFAVDKHEFQFSTRLPATCLPVSRIYILQNGEDLRLETVPFLEAMIAVGRECFVRLRCANSDVLASHLKHCGDLVNSGLLRKLVRQRGFARLDAVIRAVEADLGLA